MVEQSLLGIVTRTCLIPSNHDANIYQQQLLPGRVDNNNNGAQQPGRRP